MRARFQPLTHPDTDPSPKRVFQQTYMPNHPHDAAFDVARSRPRPLPRNPPDPQHLTASCRLIGGLQKQMEEVQSQEEALQRLQEQVPG